MSSLRSPFLDQGPVGALQPPCPVFEGVQFLDQGPNVLRDAQTMPELAALLEGSVVPYLGAVRDLLAEGWEVNDDRRRRLLATLKLVIDFHTWRSLERESGLSREEAVETMLEAVRSAVSRPGTP